MPEKIKYNIASQSKAPLTSSIFSFVSVILLCVVYWPVFVQYFSGGVYDGPEVGVLVVIFYGSLIAGLLLYSILTLVFAKKTLAPSAILALVPSLFYILDISGLRNVILFFDADKTFSYYSTKAAYFSAAWPFVTALTLLTILSAVSYMMLSASRRRGFATTFIVLNTLVWLVFSVYYVVVFAAPELASKTITARDFAYSVINNIAASLYFVSQFIIAAALKKSIPASPSAEAILPISDITEINLLPATQIPISENNDSVPVEAMVQTPVAEAGDASAIDVVIHTDSTEADSLDVPAPPETLSEPETPDRYIEQPEPAMASVIGTDAELSATDIDALAAVDAVDVEIAEPGESKDIEPASKKTEPKKKTPKKSGTKPKKNANKPSAKSEKQNTDIDNVEVVK